MIHQSGLIQLFRLRRCILWLQQPCKSFDRHAKQVEPTATKRSGRVDKKLPAIGQQASKIIDLWTTPSESTVNPNVPSVYSERLFPEKNANNR
ncbi:hypothetical protein N9D38_07070 [Rubripirellula sp.]|nr:hypothetical protein [Rubripirellula sp.]